MDLDRPLPGTGSVSVRTGPRHLARAIAVVLAICGTMCLSEGTVSRNRLSWTLAAHLEIQGRALLERLNEARLDLLDLGQTMDVTSKPDTDGRRTIVREVRGFLATRSWPRSVLVAPEGVQPILLLTDHGTDRCSLLLADAARPAPADLAYLAWSGGEPTALCLGVQTGGRSGRRVVILVEADPRALLGVADTDLGLPGLVVSDRTGAVVVGSGSPVASPRRASLAMPISGWHGPAAGTWRLSTTPWNGAGATTRAALLMAGGALVTLALAVFLVASPGLRRFVVHRRHGMRADLCAVASPRVGPAKEGRA